MHRGNTHLLVIINLKCLIKLDHAVLSLQIFKLEIANDELLDGDKALSAAIRQHAHHDSPFCTLKHS
jgi:hypothetical protein